jgi:hypothetical protein
VKVIARELGFFGGHRVKPGAIFEMPEAHMKKDKDGKPVLPRWVVAVKPGDEELEKDLVEAEKFSNEYAFAKGIVASSSTAPGVKEQLTRTVKKMFGIESREERMVAGARAASTEGVIGKAAMSAKAETYAEGMNRQYVGKPLKSTAAPKRGSNTTGGNDEV